VPVEEGAERLVKVMRDFRPHVVTTYDENGGYPHPDHVMCHKISVAAFEAAPDPDAYPDAGDPWQPLKLYYDVGWSRERLTVLHDAMTAHGLESPFAEWLERWKQRDSNREDRREPNVTTRVWCAAWFPRRDAALIAHATQVDPEGSFFRIPLAVQQEAWPTEDFELVQSLVDTTLPEDDLFAGVREKVAS
jgi:mycothiol S-conjugate amidase